MRFADDRQTAALGDRVWFDRNGNGLQESGEAGVAGVTRDALSCRWFLGGNDGDGIQRRLSLDEPGPGQLLSHGDAAGRLQPGPT